MHQKSNVRLGFDAARGGERERKSLSGKRLVLLGWKKLLTLSQESMVYQSCKHVGGERPRAASYFPVAVHCFTILLVD